MGIKETTVINIFGGPSAGKTGCAWNIGSELKRRGESVEYVSEYAKELVWDENFELLTKQKHIHEVQSGRVKRLIGKVAYIVTDSPVLMGIIYGRMHGVDIEAEATEFHNLNKSLNLFLERSDSPFEAEGRVHNLQESIDIDNQIKQLLAHHAVKYLIINHENAIETVNRELFHLDA